MASPEALAKMDPEFADYIKSLPEIPRVRGSIPEMRINLANAKKKMTEAAGPPPVEVHQEDFTIPARDGYSIPARVYKPRSPPSSGSPLIVAYHGGGYCLGDMMGEEMNCRNFAKEFGAVCVNCEYRLAPEWKFPYAINDAWDVLQWAATNTTQLNADPSKGFIVFGNSAGAGLAIVLSHLARDKHLAPALTGLTLVIPTVFDPSHPPAEYKDSLKSYTENADAAVLDITLMHTFLQSYGADPDSKLFTPFAGPASGWSFKDLPKTVVFVAGGDVLRDDGLVYERVLQERGTQETKLVTWNGVPHSFWSFAPHLKISQKVPKDFVEGVRWLLG